MTCECCGAPIRIMCQVRFCCGRCEDGKCGHPRWRWPQYPKGNHGPIDYPPKNGARF